MRAIPIMAICLLAGCSTPTVYMDPKTGAVQQCNPSAKPVMRQYEIDKCSDAFERMGWKKQ